MGRKWKPGFEIRGPAQKIFVPFEEILQAYNWSKLGPDERPVHAYFKRHIGLPSGDIHKGPPDVVEYAYGPQLDFFSERAKTQTYVVGKYESPSPECTCVTSCGRGQDLMSIQKV